QAAAQAANYEAMQAQQAKVKAAEEAQAALAEKSKINSDVLNNKVPEDASEDALEVLNRINREKEEARKRAVEKQWKQRQEEERIAAIMNSNKVDVGAFIEEGKSKAKATELEPEQSKSIDTTENTNVEIKEESNITVNNVTVDEAPKTDATDEQLRRAQEIIDRLNREAAEDEAKKQAEIDAAKQAAKEAGF
ncbi:MAG: hypothetical protein IJT72_01830, partial [Lachnospiraceae bacterium]|nr:hypothetical protein [Lachnospiraceae bacterium]